MAIGIVLRPPKTLEGQVQFLNSKLYRENPKGFLIDEHHLPHLSLLQMYIQKKDLKDLTEIVESLKQKKLTLKVNKVELVPVKSDLNLKSVVLDLSKTPQIEEFQKFLLEKTQNLSTKGTKNAFFQPGIIGSGTVDDVRDFGRDSIGARYRPHISLGITESTVFKEGISSKQFQGSYDFEEAYIVHLGEFRTARKVLARIKLL